MPAPIEITSTSPASANDPTTISPRARRGRSNFTQVITSVGLSEGRGMAEKEFPAAEGLAVGAPAFVTGLGEALGTGLAMTWGLTAQA